MSAIYLHARRGFHGILLYNPCTRITFVLQTRGVWNETFLWRDPVPFLNGEYFEVFVENRYGFTSGLSLIDVIKKEGKKRLKNFLHGYTD